MERAKKFLPAAALAVALLLLACVDAAAQCAMCKSSASSLDPGGVKHLNFAILILLVPPVGIFCGFFVAAYRRRNSPADARPDPPGRESGDTDLRPTHQP